MKKALQLSQDKRKNLETDPYPKHTTKGALDLAFYFEHILGKGLRHIYTSSLLPRTSAWRRLTIGPRHREDQEKLRLG